MVEFGYCLHDDTPLVPDEEMNELVDKIFGKEIATIMGEHMVKCPKCGSSYHEGNPCIKMTSEQATKKTMAEAEINWRKNHPRLIWR